MFGFLKKQLQKGVEKLARKVKEEGPEEEVAAKAKPAAAERAAKAPVAKRKAKVTLPPSERPIEVREDEAHERLAGPAEEEGAPAETMEIWKEPEAVAAAEPEKKGLFSRLRGAVTEKTLTAEDIDGFFDESETELLQNNVAIEVSDFLRKELKEKLVEKPIKRSQAESVVLRAFEESIFDAVNQGSIDLEGKIKAARKEGRPLLVVFLGFNGSGKTSSIGKLAQYLTRHKHGVVVAAGDTFRAASIEQLETHAKRVGVDIVKHRYGADAAAVIFDAVQHARSTGLDVVLADTAGRTHTDKNLMEE
ncbi:MAG: hypothetical protein FJY76_04045, partial [Candidatus Aenigmarchaeota archaeon]|nr:hypothetical protein [Candidatus Aenigmarchaeota archaeon]